MNSVVGVVVMFATFFIDLLQQFSPLFDQLWATNTTTGSSSGGGGCGDSFYVEQKRQKKRTRRTNDTRKTFTKSRSHEIFRRTRQYNISHVRRRNL